MILINIEKDDVRVFMNKLMKEDMFDSFEVRLVDIHTFTKFEITGVLYKDFVRTNEEEEILNDYILWSNIKSYVFDIIKGSLKPSLIKIVFSVQEINLDKIHENAKSLFLNITFENDIVKCTTGTSQREFTIDKSVDNSWDGYVVKFLKHNNISYILEDL